MTSNKAKTEQQIEKAVLEASDNLTSRVYIENPFRWIGGCHRKVLKRHGHYQVRFRSFYWNIIGFESVEGLFNRFLIEKADQYKPLI